METVIGLNLNHHDTCIFTKSIGGEGLREFKKFIDDTLRDAVRLITLRLEDRRLLGAINPWNYANCFRGISVRNNEYLLAYNERTTSKKWVQLRFLSVIGADVDQLSN